MTPHAGTAGAPQPASASGAATSQPTAPSSAGVSAAAAAEGAGHAAATAGAAPPAWDGAEPTAATSRADGVSSTAEPAAVASNVASPLQQQGQQQLPSTSGDRGLLPSPSGQAPPSPLIPKQRSVDAVAQLAGSADTSALPHEGDSAGFSGRQRPTGRLSLDTRLQMTRGNDADERAVAATQLGLIQTYDELGATDSAPSSEGEGDERGPFKQARRRSVSRCAWG